MKVLKQVTLTGKVEIEITVDDIGAAIANSGDDIEDVLQGINRLAVFLIAIPDFMISGMTKDQREKIKDFFIEQAGRFNEKEKV